MEVMQIAEGKAELLNRLSNWEKYSTYDGSYDPRSYERLSPEELQHIRLETMTEKLAWSRAEASNRDFQAVLKEVELEVTIQLAKILADTVDPAFSGTKAVAVDDEDGLVCGVCQEELGREDEARALGCMHKFHAYCIVEWLRRKTACPFCRYQMKHREFHISF